MFTVIGTNRALDKLADPYVALDLERQDHLAASIDALNHRIATDPLDEGESRTDNYRITFVGALVVRLWVDTANGVVRVYGIRRYRN